MGLLSDGAFYLHFNSFRTFGQVARSLNWMPTRLAEKGRRSSCLKH